MIGEMGEYFLSDIMSAYDWQTCNAFSRDPMFALVQSDHSGPVEKPLDFSITDWAIFPLFK
jgi:hypothetical protein